MSDFPYTFTAGQPHPLGATVDAGGINFAVFADRATRMALLLFASHDAPEPMQTIELDSTQNRTFHVWHVYVEGLRPGTHYAYRVDGPQDLHGAGDRYDYSKVLIDPYARGNTNTLWSRAAACGPGNNVATAMRSVVIETGGYDWEGDRLPKWPMNQTIIYEMHVRGFTYSNTSGCRNPGTFDGIVEKIPYLKELGITTVELLPVFDFDETTGVNAQQNYWGYDPISFFAPHTTYCRAPEQGIHLNDFRDMVKALHRNNIEVILDVVFNHTTEGNEHGPMISLKGLANAAYYLLDPQDRQYYLNFSGCGNSVRANHPITQKLIIDALQFWVEEMHVDGFRFDEATVLCRGDDGAPIPYPPVIWTIALSDVFADTKIIAEAWDAGGLYEVGSFPGERWAEWNGQFRDTVRRFVKGDRGYIDGKTIVGHLGDVIAGSANIYQPTNRLPINSVNFVTCHDGFTLNDLVSYDDKHNEANGEGNTDGTSNNLSWNCGVEGPTTDPAITALRERQIRNFTAILFLSQGVPMIGMGDEVRRTQGGNNNAYCQDNATSWLDWGLLQEHSDLLRFFQCMIRMRKEHRILQRVEFFTGRVNGRGLLDIAWHGTRLHTPGWTDPDIAVLAFTLGGFDGDADIHVMLNMDGQDQDFDVPPIDTRQWYRSVDTALSSPYDIADPGTEEVEIADSTYRVQGRSVVVLVSR